MWICSECLDILLLKCELIFQVYLFRLFWKSYERRFLINNSLAFFPPTNDSEVKYSFQSYIIQAVYLLILTVTQVCIVYALWNGNILVSGQAMLICPWASHQRLYPHWRKRGEAPWTQKKKKTRCEEIRMERAFSIDQLDYSYRLLVSGGHQSYGFKFSRD